MSPLIPECTAKCRSTQHADEVVAVLTCCSEKRLQAFLSAHCYNAATLKDAFGRTALHLAASTGKKALLEWLVESKNADLLAKDKESGWTPLHRSVFYGQIHCLMALVKHGGLLSSQDREGLSVLDLTVKDRPEHVVFKNTDPMEVYTWGNNTNFSLGQGNQESRQHPELVDFFARSGVYVKQVVLSKFHSVFLSQKGQVFTCGHGQGGRLGHGDEQTYLVPRMVEGLTSHHCTQVAAAKDHTVVLTEGGYVYTFGLNTFHQLGLSPPPASAYVPKQVFSKNLKGRTVIGVAAGRFHTVLWTREAVYTMGLNGGHLGYLLDPNGEKCVTAPRQVSALHHKDVSIAMVAASNGATVVATEKGDLYLLADYQCKKLASRQLNIKKVLVSGGSLDHRVAPQTLNEGVGEKIAILALDEAGRVFCWRSFSGSVRQCRWAYGRQVFVSDIALSKNNMMFVTQEGEGFTGVWAGEYKKFDGKKDGSVEVCGGHSSAATVYERIRLEKLPYVHRAVGITSDSKGSNFGVLQSDPKTSLFEIPIVSPSSFSQHFGCLLQEADETDSIHDVTLQASDRTFPAHKYILSMRSEFFRKLFMCEGGGGGMEEAEADGEVQVSEDAVGCDLVLLEKIPADMLEHALSFIYTDSCELLLHGTRPTGSVQERLISSLQEMDLRGRSALDVYRSLVPGSQRDADKTKKNAPKPGKKAKGARGDDKAGANGGGSNPVKALQGIAKKLGLASLSARLDGVKYENGRINVVHKKTGNKLKFNQKKCAYLCDVTLKSEEGKEFRCHKSVLCARLEYFQSMLGNPWVEAASCTALEMPTSSEILQVILEYVYTDESPTIKECLNVEFVCSVLVVADQLLITRLKEMSETAITENLTLKNAAELLEFAAMYNAEQLKLSCLQFIALNMAALLEAKALDVLSDEVLLELSASYRRMIPAMQKRVITPYLDAPDLRPYEEEDSESVVFSPKTQSELEPSCRLSNPRPETLLKKAKVKAKKKPRRRSESSGGYTISDRIQCPPVAVVAPCLVTSCVATSSDSLQELMTSDSDGSFTGAASPRDLQSPVFHDKVEVSEGITSHSFLVYGNTRTNNNRCFPKPEECFSPLARLAGPLPILDLRTIMHMEAGSFPAPGATPRSPGRNQSSPTPVSRATPVKSAPASRSFRDLLAEEESIVGSGAGQMSGGSDGQATQGSPVTMTTQRRVTFKCAEPSELEKTSGPWVLGAVGSPPRASTVPFTAILEEEKQQEAALIRSREKPLALIQIEECAIQQLLIHYKARDNPDELIVVERSSMGPIATPTWNKQH
uniref:Inhibitor of Bruton tyrosine kinase n=1 Tax=Gadus morhua TaxID=8049 RepID=A0A8C5CVI0_GADMO